MQCVAGDNVSISLCLPHRIKLLGKNFTRLFSGPEADKVPDAQVHYWITHFNCILEGEGGSVAGLSPAMQRPLAPNLGKTWEKKNIVYWLRGPEGRWGKNDFGPAHKVSRVWNIWPHLSVWTFTLYTRVKTTTAK